MILIADSGSTKTEWLLVGKQGIERTFRTSGINPYFLGEEEIRRVLTREVLVELPIERITDVYFTGRVVSVCPERCCACNCIG